MGQKVSTASGSGYGKDRGHQTPAARNQAIGAVTEDYHRLHREQGERGDAGGTLLTIYSEQTEQLPWQQAIIQAISGQTGQVRHQQPAGLTAGIDSLVRAVVG